MVDATVLFAATGWPRWSHEVIRHGIKGDFDLLLSPLVIAQARRNVTKKLPSLLNAFDRMLGEMPSSLVNDPTDDQVVKNLTLVRHKDDVPVALAAINAKVDYFVTEDKDFTAEDETTAVRQRLNIMRPVIFLREVMGWSSEELERIRGRTWKDLQKPPKAGNDPRLP